MDTDPSPEADPTAPLAFTNVTAASGIGYEVGFLSPEDLDVDFPAIPTSGAAAGDYDNDGDIDIFVVRGDTGSNLLYRNNGDLTFTDVAVEAGVAMLGDDGTPSRQAGRVLADLDGDTYLDLFMRGLISPAVVLTNNGDGTFSNVTDGSGFMFTGLYGMSSPLGDYDLDLATSHWGSPHDPTQPGDTEHLWRNDSTESGIIFTSVSEIAPIIINHPDPLAFSHHLDRTFTPTFARINEDLFPDLLMIADFNQSQFFTNNGNGTFTNSTDVDVLIDGNGMGTALGDYDNDGDLGWFVTSILDLASDNETATSLSRIGNRLYQNHQGVFSDVTDAAGVADGGWGWGACFIDFENDGDLDIYHTNGWTQAVEPPNNDPDFPGYAEDSSRAFENLSDGTFIGQSEELGLHDTTVGRGVICADFDNDGDTDILPLADRPILWRNNASAEFLKVRLRGAAPNTEAAGARVIVTTASNTQLREIIIGSNFLSQNPTEQVFGLGTDTLANVTVAWSDGSEFSLTDVASRQTLVIVQ